MALPNLPVNIDFEAQGEYAGKNEPAGVKITQTHRGNRKDNPQVKGTEPNGAMRYKEN